MSLQMPVLAKDAKYYDYLEILDKSYPRIESGLEFLKSKGYQWIAVVAHSCSVHMTMEWIREVGDTELNAYVGIGMGATDYRQPMLEDFPITEMSVPILDIYGDADYPAVLREAEARKTAMELAGNPNSEQIELAGPDHFFEGYEDELVEAVGEWILTTRAQN